MLRSQFGALRQNLDRSRREEAKLLIFEELYPKLAEFEIILSFSSLADEIDLWPLNQKLSEEKRLALPRLEDHLIQPYKVFDTKDHLKQSAYKIYEPSPHLCVKLPLDAINCILVPGLCFDSQHHRLGFGKGHYDRFLSQFTATPLFGVGFKEQYIEALPTEPHDIALTKLFLF